MNLGEDEASSSRVLRRLSRDLCACDPRNVQVSSAPFRCGTSTPELAIAGNPRDGYLLSLDARSGTVGLTKLWQSRGLVVLLQSSDPFQ